MANKKKKQEKGFIEEFNEKRKENPAYNSLLKLIIGFSAILIILLLNFFVTPPITIVQKNEVTIPANAVSYKTLLDEKMKDGTSYKIDIEDNGVKSRLEGTIKENNIEGTLESSESTDKFIIKDGKYYVIKFDEESVVDISLNLGIINIIDLIKTLENNKSLKTIENEKIINYKYDLVINNVSFEVNTKVENKIITSIEAKNENIKYTIVFK